MKTRESERIRLISSYYNSFVNLGNEVLFNTIHSVNRCYDNSLIQKCIKDALVLALDNNYDNLN